MWLLLLLVVYISLFLSGRHRPQHVPPRFRPLFFIPASLPDSEACSSSCSCSCFRCQETNKKLFRNFLSNFIDEGYLESLGFTIESKRYSSFHDTQEATPNSLPEVVTSSAAPREELMPFNDSKDPIATDDHVLQPYRYDVFISFRGADVRENFLSHLYSHLNDYKKLSVYKDDVDLERGEHISEGLLLAIERSEVYIVILSPKYTDSPWCLEELEEILKCMKLYGRRVIPVFYGVNPSEVENQKLPSSIPTAGRIRSWRAALSEIANLSGFDSQVIRPETKLIEEIVKAVFQAIRRSRQIVNLSSYSASRGLVGVERKMEQVAALLCLGDRSNRTIGLWGMAGVGKTTLAKAFFDLLSSEFEASYVFNDFAEAMARQPIGILQNDFFSKVLGDQNSRAGGTSSYDLMVHRLGRVKAMVVIDDVGNDVGSIGSLKDLLYGQYCDLFGPGSVIIMTSRNQQLLKSVCHHVYEVRDLDYEEALRLFCSHAFREESVSTQYLKMIWRAIDYVGGNPLAITILGAHLYGRDLKFWDRELEALQDNPNFVVENVLRRSYDGLTRAEKDVFLDVACFYPYWSSVRLERFEVLEGGRWNLIMNLIDKSLIRSGPYIEMSRLIQDFGRSIVNEERQIENRSRLWKPEDISYFFKKNKGTQSTEGILHTRDVWDTRGPDTCLQTDAFAKTENLRFLVIRSQTCTLFLPEKGLKCLPNALRILVWYHFTSKCLPSQFSGENLVTLDLSHSTIEQLWECEGNVDLANLNFLVLHGCESLKRLPNLSTAKRLKEIDLSLCMSLVELPTSVLGLIKLESLDVSYCSNLKWDNLERYADSRHEWSGGSCDILPNLKRVDLSWTPIKKIPSFITWLQILELDCSCCRKLTEFPVIPSLEELTLMGSLIEAVVGLEKLTQLKRLILSENKQLVLISGDFFKLKCLGKIQLDGCSKLSHLPDSIGSLVHLESLDLSRTAVTELPSSIGDLQRLDRLDLFGCDQLRHLVELPSSVRYLDADGCKSLQTLSIGIVEKHDFTNTTWSFAQCWKLDPVACSKLVDKFAQDSVGSSVRSSLLLPAKWRSTMRSNDGDNNTMVTAKLRGQPWKSKSTIFCAILDSPDPLLMDKDYEFIIECVMLNNEDDARDEVFVSSCDWKPFGRYEDQKEEHLSKGHFLVWSTSRPLVPEENEDGGSTIEFLFRGSYRTTDRSETYEILDLIKNCWVIPVYDSRIVTNEDEDEDEDEEEDDGDQSPNDLWGLYDLMCA